MMLAEVPRNQNKNPHSIAENEEFTITRHDKALKFTKIHTLGVSSLCGLATIAEYIIRRPFTERKAIYTNILKYAHRKNLGDPADPADSPDARNPQLKLDAIDPRYFLLVEQFQEARNEKLKSFLKKVTDDIKNDLPSTGAVSDSVTASVVYRKLAEISSVEIKKIQDSLEKLSQDDANLCRSTYQEVFKNELVDVIAFDEFKELFQVKSISEIFAFANERANKLKGAEGIDSQTVSFFTAYFNEDNSCQLWIINLLQNYEQLVNESFPDAFRLIENDDTNQNEDYSFNHLQFFFKLAINQAIDDMLPCNEEPNDLTKKNYKRRILNIQKQANTFSIFAESDCNPNVNYNISCFFTGGAIKAGAGHYSYSQREGEEKFPQPSKGDLAPDSVSKKNLEGGDVVPKILNAEPEVGPSSQFSASPAVAPRTLDQPVRPLVPHSAPTNTDSLLRAHALPTIDEVEPVNPDPTYDFYAQFTRVRTTGYKNYCAYGSIANYVKFLSVDKRMAFYKKLFSSEEENLASNRLEIFDNGNITDESRDELLILEIFLTLREKATSTSSPEYSKWPQDNAAWPAHDKLLYNQATQQFQKKFNKGGDEAPEYPTLDYNSFIKKYKIFETSDQSFAEKRAHSYQIWIAEFLKNKLHDINKDLDDTLQAIETETTQNIQVSSNLFEDQKSVLFDFYFAGESNATIFPDNQKIKNPEVANKDLLWFHRAIILAKDGTDLDDDKKLFYELYDYFLKTYYIEKQSNNDEYPSIDKVLDHSQTARYKHFYQKENYDKSFQEGITSFMIILSEVESEQDRKKDLGEFIFSKAQNEPDKVLSTFLKVKEHFQKEFSFEKQFLNLLHSDSCLTHASGTHFTTMIPIYKFGNPFPDNNSNLAVEPHLQLGDEKQLEIQKKNVEEAYKSSVEISNRTPQNPQATLSPSTTLINSYHSTSFERLHGRKNNNYSFEDIREDQSIPPFSKINSIINELRDKLNLDDRELALAIFLSKKFGGIGTKTLQINEHYIHNQDILDYIRVGGRLNKLIKFSYQFQQECMKIGIYSGNEKLNDDGKKKYGLRLAFIPDEIFRLHLNKLPYNSSTKKFIIKEVMAGQTSQRR